MAILAGLPGAIAEGSKVLTDVGGIFGETGVFGSSGSSDRATSGGTFQPGTFNVSSGINPLWLFLAAIVAIVFLSR